MNPVAGHRQASFEFALRPGPPFRLDLTVWALRRRPRNLMDRWDGNLVVRQRLLELRGVGRWTAEYVLLRGLGRLHIFPGDDVGAQKRLARWLGRPGPMDYADVCRAVERWQPYAGLVYFHLLLDGLSRTDAIQG